MRFLNFLQRGPSRSVDHPVGNGCLHPIGPDGTPLADEMEAWLNGELADLRSSSGQPLPSWLLLNRAAHADVALLRRVALGLEPPGRSPSRSNATWVVAEQGLVRQLFHRAAPRDVVLRQRGVLVPLELRLIEQARTGSLTLGQVIAATMKALGERQPEQ